MYYYIFVLYSSYEYILHFLAKAGFYWFYLFEWYAAAFSVVVFGVIECIVIVWAYGILVLFTL